MVPSLAFTGQIQTKRVLDAGTVLYAQGRESAVSFFMCECQCVFGWLGVHPAPKALTFLGFIFDAPGRFKVRRKWFRVAIVLVMLMQSSWTCASRRNFSGTHA